MIFLISPITVLSLLLETTDGSSDITTRASVPSSDSNLPRMISLLFTVSMNLS